MNDYVIVPWVPTDAMVYAMENSCWDTSDQIPIDKNSIQYAMWVQIWQDAIRACPKVSDMDQRWLTWMVEQNNPNGADNA